MRSFSARSSQSLCLLISFEEHDKMFVFSAPQHQSSNPVKSYSMPYTEKYTFSNEESVQGLICVSKSGYPQIWNPTTRRFSTLPKVASRWKQSLTSYRIRPDRWYIQTTVYALYWSSSSSASGSYSGRRMESHPRYPCTCQGSRCINGVLNYVANPSFRDEFVNEFMVSFHVKSEKLGIIKVPWIPWNGNRIRGPRFLVDYEGKLVTVISGHEDIDLWTLEDAEKQEWSHKHLTLPFPCIDPISRQNRFMLKSVNDAGEFIYLPVDFKNPFVVIYFDPKGNSFRRVVVEGVGDDQFRRRNDLGDKPLLVTSVYSNHIETLMSL